MVRKLDNQNLSKEELAETWDEFKKGGERLLRDKLIMNYLHLVKYVVGRVGATLPPHAKTEDMFSTGVLGLIKAIDKYDPSKKNKFETYAILLIKGAIIDEMRAMDWVPRSVHQKASLVAKSRDVLQQKLGREPTDMEVADHMGLKLEDFEDLLLRIRPAVMIPLNVDPTDDEEGTRVEERIPDQKAKTSFEMADNQEFRKLLEKAVLELPEQERTVLVLYYYENLMLKEIGEVLGVSESRVSQIHTKAVMRMRGRLQSFAKEFSNLF